MPPERLQKVLADAGVASRRASEALIAAGRVQVDGRVARLGDRADPAVSRIELDGRPVGPAGSRTYLVLHKPAGVTSTTADRHAERTVLELLPTALVPERARLYPVGRLDRDSEGLLLLTDDGEWAERVLHPRFGVEREYAVAVVAPLSQDQRSALATGIRLEEGLATLTRPLAPIGGADRERLERLLEPPGDPGLRWYRARLGQGWKRQLRRMFGAVGAPVVRLVRVRVGPLALGDLRSGGARRLTEREVAALGSGQVGIRKRAPSARRRPPRRPRSGYAPRR